MTEIVHGPQRSPFVQMQADVALADKECAREVVARRDINLAAGRAGVDSLLNGLGVEGSAVARRTVVAHVENLRRGFGSKFDGPGFVFAARSIDGGNLHTIGCCRT